MSTNADHVLMHDGSQGFFGLSCAHCGTKQAVATPAQIDIMQAVGETFLRLHRDCSKPEPSALVAP